MFDASGGIILFNDRYAQLTRMSAASLEGRTLLDVVRTRNLPVSPEAFVAEVVEAMRQAIPTRASSRLRMGACSASSRSGSRRWKT